MKNLAGSSPLHLTSDSDVVSRLLASGADPNSPDTNGNTPLHVAVRGRHKEIVRMLLEKKADTSLANKSGKTPVNLAKDKEMKNILSGKVSMVSSIGKRGRGSASPVVCSGASHLAAEKTMTPECKSPGILKRRRLSNVEDDTPKKKGPRLTFSDVNDYSGVEVVNEEKRVKVTPIYSEPQFSSDED